MCVSQDHDVGACDQCAGLVPYLPATGVGARQPASVAPEPAPQRAEIFAAESHRVRPARRTEPPSRTCNAIPGERGAFLHVHQTYEFLRESITFDDALLT